MDSFCDAVYDLTCPLLIPQNSKVDDLKNGDFGEEHESRCCSSFAIKAGLRRGVAVCAYQFRTKFPDLLAQPAWVQVLNWIE